MNHKICILFFTRITKNNSEGLVPIYIRITVNGKRIEQASGRFIKRSNWSSRSGRMIGTSAEAKNLNNYLDTIKSRVYSIEREMVLADTEISYQTFKNKWLGVKEKPRLILEVFKQHNEEMSLLAGKDFSPTTVLRYTTSFNHTINFIRWKYNVDDFDIQKLDYNFISSYAFWFKSVRNCNHNTTMKYLTNFKKMVIICIKNGWLNKDPFMGFKFSKRDVERPFLTDTELLIISLRKFNAARLALVRDIFIFSCYTGLAYADVKKLRRSEINTGVDGDKWIFTRRQKTQTPFRIPLLPVAKELIKKYENDAQCQVQDRLLPVLSNQKMNAYLKEIADLCDINKNLTFHIARHTFATTVTLSNGVPIETVSRMLGHKNLKTTQHYAKILDMKVSEDMKALTLKFDNKV